MPSAFRAIHSAAMSKSAPKFVHVINSNMASARKIIIGIGGKEIDEILDPETQIVKLIVAFDAGKVGPCHRNEHVEEELAKTRSCQVPEYPS